MKPLKMAMMAIATVALAGCTTGDDPVRFTGSIKPVAPTLTADVAPDYAAAYLPRVAGRVEAVRQTSAPDQVFQTILYPNPGYHDGENELKVSIAPRASGSSYFQAPTARQIALEMRDALPGVSMRMSGAVGENLHGAFGYATGAPAGGGACIFAWQTAEDIGRADQSGFNRLRRTHYAAKVRLRYCHPDMGEAALVSLMSGLRIREVTATTVEMLRFAEGSGVPAQAAYVSAQKETPAVTEPARTIVRSAVRPADDEVEEPAFNAPRVLKPGDLATRSGTSARLPVTVTAAASEDEAVSVAKAAAVPLPGDLKR